MSDELDKVLTPLVADFTIHACPMMTSSDFIQQSTAMAPVMKINAEEMFKAKNLDPAAQRKIATSFNELGIALACHCRGTNQMDWLKRLVASDQFSTISEGNATLMTSVLVAYIDWDEVRKIGEMTATDRTAQCNEANASRRDNP